MTTPEQKPHHRAQEALDSLTRARITPEQQRKAALGGQVGGSAGALTGTVLGASIGGATAYATRGKLNRVIARGEKGTKEVKDARRRLKDLKRPAERATTGAFLGAGSGTALGGGGAAALGLYTGRPSKVRDGDGDGKLNEGKVKKALTAQEIQREIAYDKTPAGKHNTKQMKRAWNKAKQPEQLAAAGAGGSLAATLSVAGRSPRRLAATAVGAGATAGFAAAHKKARSTRGQRYLGDLQRRRREDPGPGSLSKAFDPARHERGRDGKFAKGSGMHEVPGASKPGMSGEQKKKVVANSVAGLGVAGSVADAAALKAGWAESKNTVKPTLAPDATRRVRTLARAKYVAGKGSFPLQVVGLAAGLGGSYFARQAGKNQEKNVAKSFDELVEIAKANRENTPRYDKASGQRVRNRYNYNSRTPDEKRQHNTGRNLGALAGAAGLGTAAFLKNPQIANKVSLATHRLYGNKKISFEGAQLGISTANALRNQPLISAGAGAVGGAVVGDKVGSEATLRYQNRGTTTRKPRRDQAGRFSKAVSVDELFAKARDDDRREVGAAAAGTGLVGAGAAGEVRGRRLRADARVAQSNTHVFHPKSGLFGTFTPQQENKIAATRMASKATGNLRAGRSAALMGGTALAATAVGRHNRKKDEVAKAFDESKLRRDESGKFSRKGESKAAGNALSTAGLGAAVGGTAYGVRAVGRHNSDAIKAAYNAGQAGAGSDLGAKLNAVADIKAVHARMNRASLISGGVSAAGAGAVLGGAVLNRKATERRLARQQAERREKKIAKAADQARDDDGKFARQRGNSQRKLTNQRNAATRNATVGATLLGAGEAIGLAADRGAGRAIERGNRAARVANTSPGAQWLTPEHRKKARDIYMKAPVKAMGLRELRGAARFTGRVYGGLTLAGGALIASQYRENKRKHEKKFGPVTKSQEPAMNAPDIHELFAKARKQYEASTGAQIAGAGIAAVGTSSAGHALTSSGVSAARATTRGTRAHTEAVQVARLGQRLKSPKAAAISAGVGALAGTAATLKPKKVQKSFDTADEVFSAVAKFERETKKGAKNGAMILGGVNAVTGLGTNPRAYAAGLAGGAIAGGAIGAGVGGIQAHNRQKRQAKPKAAKKPSV